MNACFCVDAGRTRQLNSQVGRIFHREVVVNRKPESLMWMYPVLLLFALALLGWGIYRLAVNPQADALLAAGAVSVIAVLAVWFLNLNLQVARRGEQASNGELLHPINERLQHISVLLNMVSEQQLISERAKAIAFRENERDALRRAIHEEMGRKDWDAAFRLADDIETVFGYKFEADQLRETISQQRDLDVRKQVDQTVASIERYCFTEQWTAALREAENLLQAFPGDAMAQRVPQDIENRRQARKSELLESWNEAVTRHDVDGSIEILKRLDLYLTPAEAADMQETARQVFKDKLLLMGQQFTLAVKERNWAEALRLGEAIARDFPNTRMAQECRDKMDVLRQKVSQPAEASA